MLIEALPRNLSSHLMIPFSYGSSSGYCSGSAKTQSYGSYVAGSGSATLCPRPDV
jgi:hypothetical protein